MIDPLAEALRSVRLHGAIFLDARFTAPWCVLAGVEPADCRPFLGEPTQLLCYHFVTEGRLVAEVEGARPLEVEAGEILLLPRNDAHLLASGPGVAPVPGRELIRPGDDGGLPVARHGGGGTATAMICGFLGSDTGFNPLIATLPPMLKIDVRAAASRSWIEASVRLAADELARGRLASSELLSRLAELLLVEAVRHHAASAPPEESGWLGALADPQVARALALLHRDIGARWTVESLARAVAMSRSAFVERFTALLGTPPIRYLTRVRLAAAKAQLRATRRPLARLAHDVGYESEEAFSRAFKREFGLSPVRWREARTPAERPRALPPPADVAPGLGRL